MTVTLASNSITLDLDAGHRTSGADFDRFGLVTTWIDGAGQHVYFDDLTYTSGMNGIPAELWLNY